MDSYQFLMRGRNKPFILRDITSNMVVVTKADKHIHYSTNKCPLYNQNEFHLNIPVYCAHHLNMSHFKRDTPCK